MVLSAAHRRAQFSFVPSIWVSQDSAFKALLKGHLPPEDFPDASTHSGHCLLSMHLSRHSQSQGICQGHASSLPIAKPKGHSEFLIDGTSLQQLTHLIQQLATLSF